MSEYLQFLYYQHNKPQDTSAHASSELLSVYVFVREYIQALMLPLSATVSLGLKCYFSYCNKANNNEASPLGRQTSQSSSWTHSLDSMDVQMFSH